MLSFWKSTETVRSMSPYCPSQPPGAEEVGLGLSNPVPVTVTPSTVLEELLHAELCLALGSCSWVFH